ncbi:MAG: DUF1043 family protein [Mariprofundus sp.]
MEIISLTGLILMTSVAIIAFLVGYLVSGRRKGNKQLETELAASREELKNYRSEVTSHFQQTAHKVNALTENCRNVYEHLAQGAQELCNKDDAPQLMDELNRKRMPSDKTLAKAETISDEAATGHGSDSNTEPEKNNESPDDTTDTHTAEGKDITTGAGADKNSNRDSAT